MGIYHGGVHILLVPVFRGVTVRWEFHMTKSRAQKQRRRSGLSVPYGRQIPGGSRGRVTNWSVFSQMLTASGQVIGGVTTPTSLPTWNPGSSAASYNLISGSPVTFQAALIQPAVSGNIPTIGRMKIDELRGSLIFNDPSSNGIFTVAVGIYVSEFTINTSAWDVSDPMNPTDAARDQYFFLKAIAFTYPLTGITAAGMVEMDLGLSEPVVLGGGQALNVTVSMIASGGPPPTIFCNPCFRVRTGPVA